MKEFLIGEYEIDNSKPKAPQHKKEIFSLLTNSVLSLVISELIEDADFELKLRVLKDDLWPMQGGFGRSERYAVIAEVDE